MLADFHFLRPFWLLTLLPALILLYLMIKQNEQRGDWANVCDEELLPFILQKKPQKSRTGHWLAMAWAIVMSIFALAGPSWERIPSPAFRNDSALVIGLDLSKSMNASDIKPDRLSRARYKISDILQQRKDGQTALLVYSGDAFTVTPLTNDTATINSQLEALNTDIMPSPGSNTGIAIKKAVALLHQSGLAQGHILLVTDGADPESLAEAKSVLGDYRLSVLGIGTSEGAPIPLPGGGFLKDLQGNIVVAKLNVDELSELATIGHGIFQAVTANDQDIERLGSLFDQAVNSDKAQANDSWLQQWEDKGPWLLLLVLPWAALQFRKGVLTLGLLCLLPLPRNAQAVDWQSLWQTPDQRAAQAFRQQEYKQAADRFNDPEWRAAAQYKAGQFQAAAEALKSVQTADGHYNRGNALAQAGQLKEAIEAYEQALNLNPQHADAKYNKALVEKKLQDQQDKDKDKDKQDSEQSEQDDQQQNQQSDNQNQDNTAEDHNSEDQQSPADEQQADKKQSDKSQTDSSQQPQPEAQQDNKQESQPTPQQAEETDAAAEPMPQNPAEQDEIKRANAQLLKRIPDEPTGLLKRKFKYQYGQRDPPPHNGPDW